MAIKNIGIFGGTFNPVHFGHLKICKISVKNLNLSQVIFIPVYISPHKDNSKLIPGKHRLKMLKLAIKNEPNYMVSDYEISKEKTSYSIETVRYYKKIYPDKNLFFITGIDNINELDTWKNITELLDLCRFIAVTRPGYEPNETAKKYSKHIDFITIKGIDISSSNIRKRIINNLSISNLVPEDVERYIAKNDLYKN